MVADKRFPALIQNWPFHGDTANRIGAIEHDYLELVLSSGLQDIAQGGDIGVKATANVLNVVNESVNPRQLLGRGTLTLAVETEDRQAGLLVLAIRHGGVHDAADAVLGAEQRHEFHALGLVQ